jgi:hypothetical protein
VSNHKFLETERLFDLVGRIETQFLLQHEVYGMGLLANVITDDAYVDGPACLLAGASSVNHQSFIIACFHDF